ncbi:hypothetical protein T484DRAFT_1757709, partial [Baffinella frigidus]
MRMHLDDMEVQRGGLRVIASLAAKSPELKRFITETNVMEMAVSAMQTHPSAREVQLAGCILLALYSEAGNVRRIVDANAGESVAYVMRQQLADTDDDDVLINGLNFFLSIVQGTEEIDGYIQRCGGIEV